MPMTLAEMMIAPYFCITDSRCNICHFEIAEGEGVVAVMAGEQSVSYPFPFYRGAHFHDTRGYITFHMCMRYKCGPRSKFTVVFHMRCHQLRRDLSAPMRLPASLYAFEPIRGDDEKRSIYIRNRLGVNLSRDSTLIPASLPLELHTMIAGHLVQDSVVITALKQLNTSVVDVESVVDLTRPVYISYIKINGVPYVETLSNVAHIDKSNRSRLVLPLPTAQRPIGLIEHSDEDARLPTPQQGASEEDQETHYALPIRTLKQQMESSEDQEASLPVLPKQTILYEDQEIYVAHDHLGIRGIYFIPTRLRDEWCRSAPKHPGAWWRQMPRESLGSYITIMGDTDYSPTQCLTRRVEEQCVKMRGFDSEQHSRPRFTYRTSWPYPCVEEPQLYELIRPEPRARVARGLRMRYFECNAPDTIGYFIATDGQKPMAILTHKKDEKLDTLLFEKKEPHLMFWMYMPINKGEYLTDIGVRTWIKPHGCLSVAGITFTTNQDRTVLFGLSHAEFGTLKRVAHLSRHPSHVFFNELDAARSMLSVGFLAFDRLGDIAEQEDIEDPTQFIPPQPYTVEYTRPLWQYTSCNLYGLTEIHPCVNIKESFRPVVGLLLYYADGHRECVGQMRPDHMVEPIPISKTDMLFFRGKETPEGLKYVDLVTTKRPEDKGKDNWLEVFTCGTLEWWFWAERHVLRYSGASLNLMDWC